MTDEPFVVYIPATNNWKVMEDFFYSGHGVNVAIPKGFVCDLASIPRFLWRLMAPFELSFTAPLVHDWLYKTGGKTVYAKLSREQSDLLFRYIMTDKKVPKWRRYLAFKAVRAIGWLAWKGGK